MTIYENIVVPVTELKVGDFILYLDEYREITGEGEIVGNNEYRYFAVEHAGNVHGIILNLYDSVRVMRENHLPDNVGDVIHGVKTQDLKYHSYMVLNEHGAWYSPFNNKFYTVSNITDFSTKSI